MIGCRYALELYERFKRSSKLKTHVVNFLAKLIQNDPVSIDSVPSSLFNFLNQLSGEVKIKKLARPHLNISHIISQILMRKKHKREVVLFLKYFYSDLFERRKSPDVLRVGDFSVAFKFFQDPWFKFNRRGRNEISFKLNRKNKHVLITLPGGCTEYISRSRWNCYSKIHCMTINREITEDVNALIAIYSVCRSGYHKDFGKYGSTYNVALAIYFINNPPCIAFSEFKKVNSPEEVKNMPDEEFWKKFQPDSSHERKILKNIIRQKTRVKVE